MKVGVNDPAVNPVVVITVCNLNVILLPTGNGGFTEKVNV
jgi:hypothetical protein